MLNRAKLRQLEVLRENRRPGRIRKGNCSNGKLFCITHLGCFVMKTTLRWVFAIAVVTAVVYAHAQVSMFDTDTEGWLVCDIWPYSHIQADPPASGAIWSDAVGNPGGGLTIGDVHGWTWAQAPSHFLGNHSSSYGSTLSVDLLIRYSDEIPYPLVALRGRDITLYYVIPPPPLHAWMRHIVPLTEQGWVVNHYETGDPATEQNMRNVLSDLRGLYIMTEWRTGPDDTWFDNVVFPPGSGCSIADVNGDCCVDDGDLTAVILDFDTPGNINGNTDIDFSGFVDDADLTEVILAYGLGC